MAEDKVTIHNKISQAYRELHVDGAFGGITTRGYINLSFYAERWPIPKSSDFKVNEAKQVGDLISNSPDSKTGILREFEFGVYMDINVAKTIVEFLQIRISELDKLLKEKPNAVSSK